MTTLEVILLVIMVAQSIGCLVLIAHIERLMKRARATAGLNGWANELTP